MKLCFDWTTGVFVSTAECLASDLLRVKSFSPILCLLSFSAPVSFFLLLCFVILNICSSVEMLSHSFGSLLSHQQITAAEENLLAFPSFFFFFGLVISNL